MITMKKFLIAILTCAMILSGCSTTKKIDYSEAITNLKEKYGSDSALIDTVESFVNNAIDTISEKYDITDIGFMTTDDFDSIKTFVQEHQEDLTYLAVGIGAVVIVGDIAILVVKVAFATAVCGLIANYCKNNEKINLKVTEFSDALNGFKESIESSDLAASLKEGNVVLLSDFADQIEESK